MKNVVNFLNDKEVRKVLRNLLISILIVLTIIGLGELDFVDELNYTQQFAVLTGLFTAWLTIKDNYFDKEA